MSDKDSSSRLRHDVAVVRKAIAQDAKDLGSDSKASGHVILNWLQVGLMVGSMLVTVIGSGAVAWSKIDSIDGLLHEIKGAQDKTALEMVELRGEVGVLKDRGEEDREEISKLRYQMSYRLQFEAAAKAAHPNHPWP